MLRIREAGVEDVPLILSFTRELAEYEWEPNTVRATEDDSRRDGFSANPKFRVIIAESDGQPSRNSLLFPPLLHVAGQAGTLPRRSLCQATAPTQRHRQGPHGSSPQIAIAEHCYGMRWEVLDWNTTAIEVYQKLGARFREHWRIMQITGEDLKRLSETEV